jgi:hypothetical protein
VRGDARAGAAEARARTGAAGHGACTPGAAAEPAELDPEEDPMKGWLASLFTLPVALALPCASGIGQGDLVPLPLEAEEPAREGSNRVVRVDFTVPFARAGEISTVYVPQIPAEIERIRGIACVWTSGTDPVQVPPFLEGHAAPPLDSDVSVEFFVVDDPDWLSLFEGDGTAVLAADRSADATSPLCSGARVHMWAEIAP